MQGKTPLRQIILRRAHTSNLGRRERRWFGTTFVGGWRDGDKAHPRHSVIHGIGARAGEPDAAGILESSGSKRGHHLAQSLRRRVGKDVSRAEGDPRCLFAQRLHDGLVAMSQVDDDGRASRAIDVTLACRIVEVAALCVINNREVAASAAMNN